MKVNDYVRIVLNTPILNANNVVQVERAYNTKLSGEVRNFVATLGVSVYFSDSDGAVDTRLLSFDEILHDCAFPCFSFKAVGCVPFFVTTTSAASTVLVYVIKEQKWGVFACRTGEITKLSKSITSLL